MRQIVALSALSFLLISATAPTRTDPYKNYKFRVSLGGAYVAAFSQVTQRESMSPNAAGGGSGIPIQVPGSLVGRPGIVTLICSPAANPTAPTVTLVCSNPAGSAGDTVSKAPTFNKYDAITLERGVTQDPEFQSWASSIRSTAPRDLSIDVFNEAGQRTGGYRLTGCRVVTFQRMPNPNAGPNSLAVVALELHCNPH